MAYHEEAISGLTDATGAAKIRLGPVLEQDEVFFLGYVIAQCVDGSLGSYQVLNPLTQGVVAGFAGQLAVLGPVYLKPHESKILSVTKAPPTTRISGALVGDVARDFKDLQLTPIPTAAGANLPTYPTYSSSTGLFVVAANPTDIWGIRGSATMIVRVNLVQIFALQTTAGLVPFDLRRRSTNDAPFASDNMIRHDTNDPAATAGIVHYTANPASLGVDAGLLRELRVNVPTATSGAQDTSGTQTFGARAQSEPLTLRNQSEMAVINLGGNTVAGLQVVVNTEFTESTT